MKNILEHIGLNRRVKNEKDVQQCLKNIPVLISIPEQDFTRWRGGKNNEKGSHSI